MGKKKKDDLSGRRFGKLTAIEPTEERKHGYVVWRCRCDCGKEISVESRYLKREMVTDCGCVPKIRARKDLRGQRFGRLVVLEESEKRAGNGEVIWKCRCDCGNPVEISGTRLLSGNKKSCGCLAGPKQKDFVGKRFGNLQVISYAGKKKGCHMWLCRCQCGKTLEVRQSNLQNGHSKSCGCKNSPVDSCHFLEGTCVEMIQSKTIFKNNTSGVRGVYLDKKRNKWVAQITFQKKTYYLGSYDTKQEAAEARLKGEEMYNDFLEWYYSRNEEK